MCVCVCVYIDLFLSFSLSLSLFTTRPPGRTLVYQSIHRKNVNSHTRIKEKAYPSTASRDSKPCVAK